MGGYSCFLLCVLEIFVSSKEPVQAQIILEKASQCNYLQPHLCHHAKLLYMNNLSNL